MKDIQLLNAVNNYLDGDTLKIQRINTLWTVTIIGDGYDIECAQETLRGALTTVLSTLKRCSQD